MNYTKAHIDAAWCAGWLNAWGGNDAIRPFTEKWNPLPPLPDPSAYNARLRVISIKESREQIRQSHTTPTTVELVEEHQGLREALKKSRRAMEIWIHVYAPEFCKKKFVSQARRDIRAAGGTAALIGETIKMIDDALSARKAKKGEGQHG